MPKLIHTDKVSPHERPNAKGREKTGGRPPSGRVADTVILKKGTHKWVRANKEAIEAWALAGDKLPLPSCPKVAPKE